MLSGVLSSEKAIDVNIQIFRVFTRMREMLSTHKDILLKLEQIEKQTTENSSDIQSIFRALKALINPVEKKRSKIGFKTGKENS